MKVEFVPNTSQALEMIRGKEYDAIISDMSRPESPRAGYDLLARLKHLRPNIPLFCIAVLILPNRKPKSKMLEPSAQQRERPN
jgi:CheY-like chemotaxis protein